VADARKRFIGPLTYFGRKSGDVTWDYLNDIPGVLGAADWNAVGTEIAINAWDIGRPHCTILTLEATEGITYEVEVVRHFEIIPGEEAPHEMKSAHLSTNFSSPIDLIRKFDLAEII